MIIKKIFAKIIYLENIFIKIINICFKTSNTLKIVQTLFMIQIII